MKTTSLSMLVVLASVAWPVLSQPVKKYVTPDNKVIYSDKPVPGAREAGEVAPPPPVSPEARRAAEEAAERDARVLEQPGKDAEERRARQEQIEKLEANLARAKKELAEGKEPRPGERTGSAGGGSRLNESYWARQKANENAVAAAQRELENARAGK